MTKLGLEVLTGIFYLNLSIKPEKKFFVYKCKLSLSLALFYFVDSFINKLKTKFNNLFLQNDFKCKKNSQLLFVLNCLTVLVYTKTIIYLSVGGLWWIFTSPLRVSVIRHHKPPPLR